MKVNLNGVRNQFDQFNQVASLQHRMSDQIYLLVWTRTLDQDTGPGQWTIIEGLQHEEAAISAGGQGTASRAGTAEDQVEVQERALAPDRCVLPRNPEIQRMTSRRRCPKIV